MFRTVVGYILPCLGIVVLATAPAAAQNQFAELQGDLYRIVAAHSGKCLTVADGSRAMGTRLVQFDCHSGDNQRFRVVRRSGGYVIVANHSGQVLDVENGSSAPHAEIQQYTAHGMPNQLWNLVPAGDGSFVIVSSATRLVVDVENASLANGARIQQYLSNPGPYQRFYFVLTR